MTSVEVRGQLVEALRLDLVGPEEGSELDREVLPQAPSRWYLTGFLVPMEAGEDQRSDETASEDFDAPGEGGADSDDDAPPERQSARRAFFPSSIGISLLIAPETRRLKAEVSWGDYRAEPLDAPAELQAAPFCQTGQAPRFVFGFAALAAELGLERVVVHSSHRAVTAYQRHGFAVSPQLMQADLR